MTDYELQSGEHAIGLNSLNTMGVMSLDGLPENKRTKTYFSPDVLKEWAEAVAECYEDEGAVEVVFHKDAPVVARKMTEDRENDATLGIGAAPRLPPEEF